MPNTTLNEIAASTLFTDGSASMVLIPVGSWKKVQAAINAEFDKPGAKFLLFAGMRITNDEVKPYPLPFPDPGPGTEAAGAGAAPGA